MLYVKTTCGFIVPWIKPLNKLETHVNQIAKW